ncbi:hypothetical protein Bbelb_331720 [Branchiostoma belcheri]|nr:hypothetical protein Bbelb_331720 [Branchiostoma belcheri]
MGRILRHVLIFLLLILKEPNMPKAGCKYFFITNGNLTHIPQNIGPVLTLSYLASDHEYENLNQHTLPEQGQYSMTNSDTNTSTTAALVASGYNQTGQGKNQTLAGELHTNTTATVTISDLDHHYEDMNRHNHTRQGQSQAIIGESQTKSIAVVVAARNCDDDHQYDDMDTKHDQTAQGHSQTTSNEKSLDARNLIYTTEEPASESNPVYKKCKNDQTNHDRSQNNTDETIMDTRNVIYTTEPAASEPNSVYKSKNDQTSQDQSQDTSLHETVKTTANPKYESAGAEPAENEALSPQNRNIHHVPQRYESPQLPSSCIHADPLSAVSKPHLYEDVDSQTPQKSPKTLKEPGLKIFDENESFRTVDNTTTKDEPPPILPRKDTDPLSVDSQSHLYEDVDSPQKSPKPVKGPGLKSFDKNMSFGATDKNIPTKNEPPKLPPPREKDADALSQPHLYKDEDTQQNLKIPKPKDPDLKSFAKNKNCGTAGKIIPTKDEANVNVSSKKPGDDDEENHNYENHDLK